MSWMDRTIEERRSTGGVAGGFRDPFPYAFQERKNPIHGLSSPRFGFRREARPKLKSFSWHAEHVDVEFRPVHLSRQLTERKRIRAVPREKPGTVPLRNDSPEMMLFPVGRIDEDHGAILDKVRRKLDPKLMICFDINPGQMMGSNLLRNPRADSVVGSKSISVSDDEGLFHRSTSSTTVPPASTSWTWRGIRPIAWVEQERQGS